MQVTVLLFAALAEKAGTRELSVELPEHTTINDLLDVVASQAPEIASLLPSCLVSCNQEYAAPDQQIKPGDELALLPPVSGGEEASHRPEIPPFLVTDAPLSIESLVKLVAHPHAGAILTFIGTVREYTQGQRTVSLSYEAYTPMAIAKMEQIASEIGEHYEDVRVAMHHRIGDLQIEDIAVVIAVSTPHRAEAFEAGRYAIERLKQIVPIWKKERWEDGNEWKGHQQGPWNPLTPIDPR